MERVLVTGGAGYIGSHTVKALRKEGFVPVVLDDLSEGHREAVGGAEFVSGEIGDRALLDRLLSSDRFDAVIHFAARCYVGESVAKPALYWRRNLADTLTLLEALVEHDVHAFLFSSSCAVYGEPGLPELPEDLVRSPVNSYGHTKAAVEWAVEDFTRVHPLRAVVLRYFNAAGADPDGDLGEDHDPETHLIPLVVREALTPAGKLEVFGTDYPTPDGTCVRDYVHVTDLADAHVRGIRHLLGGGGNVTLNLGTGTGSSVLSVIRAVSGRAGREIPFKAAPRRPGDPAFLVAKPGRAETVLGWKPAWSGLEEIVDTAWRWFEAHPRGYAS